MSTYFTRVIDEEGVGGCILGTFASVPANANIVISSAEEGELIYITVVLNGLDRYLATADATNLAHPVELMTIQLGCTYKRRKKFHNAQLLIVDDEILENLILVRVGNSLAIHELAKILFDVFCRSTLRQTQCCQQQKQGKFLHIFIVFMVNGVHVVWYAHQFRHKGTKNI